ncbi:MAG: hypothetical protein VYB64_05045, partial [Pseudomonadota bacterium]|nr:hypothetical protein [Pseudomonadota bacterium]
MKVYGRLIAALLVAGGLAGCGVAVDQRTLAPVVAAPSPAAAPAPEPDPETEPVTAVPQTASLSGSVTDEGGPETDIGGETEIASLSPSAAKSIDELVAALPETAPAAPAVVVPPPPETQGSEEVPPPVPSDPDSEPAAADDG